MALYMVLNDGDTFTALGGCKVVDLPDDLGIEDEDVDEAIKEEAGTVTLATFTDDDGEGKWLAGIRITGTFAVTTVINN